MKIFSNILLGKNSMKHANYDSRLFSTNKKYEKTGKNTEKTSVLIPACHLSFYCKINFH